MVVRLWTILSRTEQTRLQNLGTSAATGSRTHELAGEPIRNSVFNSKPTMESQLGPCGTLRAALHDVEDVYRRSPFEFQSRPVPARRKRPMMPEKEWSALADDFGTLLSRGKCLGKDRTNLNQRAHRTQNLFESLTSVKVPIRAANSTATGANSEPAVALAKID